MSPSPQLRLRLTAASLWPRSRHRAATTAITSSSARKEVPCAKRNITRYGTDAQALALNHDGSRVAFSGSWGGIATRLVSTCEELPPLDQFDIGFTLGLAWHGSDPTELIGIFNRHGRRGMPRAQEWIVAWDTTTGKRIAAQRSSTPLNCLASEPGGDRLVEAGDDKMVRLRDAKTLGLIRAFRAHDGAINAIAWNPHSPMIATGSADRTVRLWDVETGRLIEELHLSLREPEALYFSPSGNRLACTIPGEKTLIWDLSKLNDPN
jgi:WD40 repeat protein